MSLSRDLALQPLPVALAASHRRAPLAIRERLAPRSEEEAEAWLRDHLSQGAVLATCNRMEVYTVASSVQEGLASLRSALLSRWKGDPAKLLSCLDSYAGEEAVRHLFEVSAGLDSMVVGEAQILGQVGDALRTARRAGTAGQELTQLFNSAIRAGRRARAETDIGRHAVSVPSVAVELARRTFESLRGRRVLVVGAGEAGVLTARALLAAGTEEVFLTNRTEERSVLAAAGIGASAWPFASLGKALAEMDIVVSATGSSEPVIAFETVQAAVGRRGGAPLLLVDIAVPRDIEPSVACIPGVSLYNVDDLQRLAERNLQQRSEAVEKVEEIVKEEVEKLLIWWRSLSALPTIRGIHREAERLRQEALGRTLRRNSHLSSEDKEAIDQMSRAIVRRLLHHPFLSLKQRAEEPEYVATVQHLFHLLERDDHGEP